MNILSKRGKSHWSGLLNSRGFAIIQLFECYSHKFHTRPFSQWKVSSFIKGRQADIYLDFTTFSYLSSFSLQSLWIHNLEEFMWQFGPVCAAMCSSVSFPCNAICLLEKPSWVLGLRSVSAKRLIAHFSSALIYNKQYNINLNRLLKKVHHLFKYFIGRWKTWVFPTAVAAAPFPRVTFSRPFVAAAASGRPRTMRSPRHKRATPPSFSWEKTGNEPTIKISWGSVAVSLLQEKSKKKMFVSINRKHGKGWICAWKTSLLLRKNGLSLEKSQVTMKEIRAFVQDDDHVVVVVGVQKC